MGQRNLGAHRRQRERAGGPGGIRRLHSGCDLAYWSDQPPGFRPFDPFVDTVRLPRPAIVEDFDDLSIDAASEDYFPTRVTSASTLCLLVQDATVAPDILPEYGSRALEGGTDDPEPLDASAYKGENPSGAPRAERQGLAALADQAFDEVALLCAPAAAVDVQQALIAHCEQMRYRFTVIDDGLGTSDPGGSIHARPSVQPGSPPSTIPGFRSWIRIPAYPSGFHRAVTSWASMRARMPSAACSRRLRTRHWSACVNSNAT